MDMTPAGMHQILLPLQDAALCLTNYRTEMYIHTHASFSVAHLHGS